MQKIQAGLNLLVTEIFNEKQLFFLVFWKKEMYINEIMLKYIYKKCAVYEIKNRKQYIYMMYICIIYVFVLVIYII